MYVFDVETDGFLEVCTRIHCLHVIDTRTMKRMRFSSGRYVDGTKAARHGSIEDGLRMLMDGTAVIGQNIIEYDIPVIKKLYPWFKTVGRVIDTMVISRLIYTDLKERDSEALKKRMRPAGFDGSHVGKHSLEAWGFRLGVFKGDYSKIKEAEAKAKGLTGDDVTHWVWGRFTKEMDDYCEQDVVGTLSLWEKLNGRNYSPEAIELEMQVAHLIALQVRTGFAFDERGAEKLAARLMTERAQLEDTLRLTFKPWYQPIRKHGLPVVMVPKVNNKARGITKGQEFTKIELMVFNPGSRAHISNRMRHLFGWVPTEFTETGEPKVDETTLSSLNYPEAKLLVRYLTVQKRLGQIAEGKQAWLKLVKNGRIHGRVNPNGARTGRMTHFSPNLAQVPAVRALFGAECRGLFGVKRGYRLVGCDAEGLELRMLGHYMARYDGGAYADTVINGKKEDGTDVHTVNKNIVGLNTRDAAKTFIYAYLYGAGAPTLGITIYEDFTEKQREAFNAKVLKLEEKAIAAGRDPSDIRVKALGRLGIVAKERIEQGLPALGKLQDLVKEKSKRGFLKGLDGRLLLNKSPHAALNTLLQGGGAIVMKKALVLAYEAFQAKGWVHGREYSFVANVHDEFQMEVRADLAEEAGIIARQAIRDAGAFYKLKCALEGAYEIGLTWADSH